MKAEEDFSVRLKCFRLCSFEKIVKIQLEVSTDAHPEIKSYWFSNLPQWLKYNLQCRTKSCDTPKHKTFRYNFSSKQKESGKYKSGNNIFSFEHFQNQLLRIHHFQSFSVIVPSHPFLPHPDAIPNFTGPGSGPGGPA